MTPSLTKSAASLFLAGVSVLVVRHYGDRLSLFWTGVLILVAFIAGAYGAAEAANWFYYNYNGRLAEYRRALSITEANEMLATVAQFAPPAQAAIAAQLGKFGIEWFRLVTNSGPVFRTEIEGVVIEEEFLRQFFEGCNHSHLTPIRTYSEGSQERRMAEALTVFLVRMGYALPAVGNQSARWHDGGYSRARVAFFGE